MRKILLILPILLVLVGCGEKSVTKEEENQSVKQIAPVVVEQEGGGIKWGTCKVGALEIACPDGWVAIERGIANMSLQDANRSNAYVSMHISGSSDYVEDRDRYISDKVKTGTCSDVFRNDNGEFIIACVDIADQYVKTYHKLRYEFVDHKEVYHHRSLVFTANSASIFKEYEIVAEEIVDRFQW